MNKENIISSIIAVILALIVTILYDLLLKGIGLVFGAEVMRFIRVIVFIFFTIWSLAIIVRLTIKGFRKIRRSNESK